MFTTIKLVWLTYSHAFWMALYADIGISGLTTYHESMADYYEGLLAQNLENKRFGVVPWLPLVLIVTFVATIHHIFAGIRKRIAYAIVIRFTSS